MQFGLFISWSYKTPYSTVLAVIFQLALKIVITGPFLVHDLNGVLTNTRISQWCFSWSLETGVGYIFSVDNCGLPSTSDKTN